MVQVESAVLGVSFKPCSKMLAKFLSRGEGGSPSLHNMCQAPRLFLETDMMEWNVRMRCKCPI